MKSGAPVAVSDLPFIGRCSVCKRSIQASITQGPEGPTLLGSPRLAYAATGPKRSKQRYIAADCAYVFRDACPGTIMFVRVRHGQRPGKSLTQCTPSCQSARGSNCDCECMGQHHGIAWARAFGSRHRTRRR